MAMSNDRSLSARPDMFELVDSPRIARRFRQLAFTAPIIPLAFAIWNVVQNGFTAIGVIFLVLAVGSIFSFLFLAKRAKEWRLRDGRPLNTRSLALYANAEESWQRLASGDPTQYTPMKVGDPTAEHVSKWINVYWPDNQRVSYVVITSHSAAETEAPKIIELHGDQHDTLHLALDNGLKKPFVR